MSEVTKAALDAAITAHVADEYESRMATAWVVAVDDTGIDDVTNGTGSHIAIITRPYQSVFTTDGLLFAALHTGH